MIDHERLDVYQLARQLRREVVTLMRSARRGSGDLASQLARCSLAIKLNIAEGSGEYAPREKARLYRIARREAAECAALLDDLEDLALAAPAELKRARHLVARIIGALVRLIQATGANAPRAGSPRRRADEAPEVQGEV